MIGFLQPVFAVAALAVAVPIILHLVRRREVRRLTFPAIRYLQRAEQRYARRLRLRHLLLLVLRGSIILVAAIAAAGPLIGRGEAEDHQPTALAIIVDESQSSSRLLADRSLLDIYVEKAIGTLDLVTRDDRVAFFSAVRPEAGALSVDVDGSREYLARLRPTAGLARLPGALRQAAAWLESTGGRAREMHVFTDVQRVSLEPFPPDSSEGGALGADVRVLVYSPDAAPEANGALGDPVPEVQPLGANLQTPVAIPLAYFGGQPPGEPTVIRLVAGDRVIGMAEGRFGEQALLRLPPQDSGWLQGYFEIERSGLAADDRRYFSWFVRPAPRLAVIGHAPDFLLHAIDALERGGRLRRVESSLADVWISIDGERLDEALAAGRSVVVHPPASPLELPRLNQRLASAGVPWRYEAGSRSGGLTRIAQNRSLPGLAGATVRSYYRLAPGALAATDTALLSLEEGRPWLIRGPSSAAGTYLLLASPLDRQASDVPVSAGMVPFIDALIGDWARRGAVEPSTLNGPAAIRLPDRAREIERPDGSRSPVEGGAPFYAAEAGHYKVLASDQVLRAFSLNAPLLESDLERGSEAALEQVLPAADWSWIRNATADGWVEQAFQQRRGRLAWRPLVVFLLLLSIVEASLAAAGRQKVTRTGGAEIDGDEPLVK